ncbi:YhbY family RNA-binding protein [Myxococcota bacterium]|nr:YhbY family RNA-binding protein [Myxococcota bacterium]
MPEEKSDEKSKALILPSHQRAYLKGLAHSLKPIVRVGQSGVTDAVIRATNEALLRHELIKVRMRMPEDKKAYAAKLADLTESALCGLVGHTAILYKENPEKPVIHLPKK